jgi:hypothetical protein
MTATVSTYEPEQDVFPQPRWTTLYRIGARAAILAAILTPATIAAFAIWPPPYDGSVGDWFALLQDNPFLGLVSLDLLFLVISVAMVPVMLAVAVANWRAEPALVLVASTLFFVSLGGYFASNPAVEMLSLSQQHAVATSATEQAALESAGEAMLATFEGTSFHAYYILGQIAGIMLGFVMLRGRSFGKAMPRLMIAGNVLGFGLYLPAVGLALSAGSGVVLWVWLIALIPKLRRLDHSERLLTAA